MQSNLQLPPRRANRGCGEHSADGEAGEVGQEMDSRRRGGVEGANLQSRFGSWLAILV